MECFDFDHSSEIAAARARLSLLIQPDTVLQEDDADEASLTIQWELSRYKTAHERDLLAQRVMCDLSRARDDHSCEEQELHQCIRVSYCAERISLSRYIRAQLRTS